jgi:hypothetical protein
MPGQDEPRPAQPGVDSGGRGVPVVDSFRLEVDGEVFDVQVDARGGSQYSWVSGPNAGYGFGSSGSGSQRPREQHAERIRSFLSMIDPMTGYISDN